jgi:hypothetical protein
MLMPQRKRNSPRRDSKGHSQSNDCPIDARRNAILRLGGRFVSGGRHCRVFLSASTAGVYGVGSIAEWLPPRGCQSSASQKPEQGLRATEMLLYLLGMSDNCKSDARLPGCLPRVTKATQLHVGKHLHFSCASMTLALRPHLVRYTQPPCGRAW